MIFQIPNGIVSKFITLEVDLNAILAEVEASTRDPVPPRSPPAVNPPRQDTPPGGGIDEDDEDDADEDGDQDVDQPSTSTGRKRKRDGRRRPLVKPIPPVAIGRTLVKDQDVIVKNVGWPLFPVKVAVDAPAKQDIIEIYFFLDGKRTEQSYHHNFLYAFDKGVLTTQNFKQCKKAHRIRSTRRAISELPRIVILHKCGSLDF